MKISKHIIIIYVLIFFIVSVLGVLCFFEHKYYNENVEFRYLSPVSDHYFPLVTLADKIQKYYITKDVGVVVRSVGERTEQACIEDLQKLFGEKNVYVIKNVTPLAKAVDKTMEHIQQTNKKWFLVVDADVLFFEDKLLGFIKSAKFVAKYEPKALFFQGVLYDKLFFRDRFVGFTLYNKKNLNYDKKFIEKCYYSIRPETCLKRCYLEAGYKSYMLNGIRIGLHAFEQYPKTTVKNGIVYARKHDIKELIPKWQENAKTDKDMQYVLLGVQIYNSLKNKNIIPDNAAMEKLMEKYDIPDLPFLHRKLMDEDIKKYNTGLIFDPFVINQ